MKNFLKDPEYNSIKSLFLVVLVIGAGYFIGQFAINRSSYLKALVNPEDVATISINLNSIGGADSVEPGIYGIHMAKLLDEAGVADGWLSTIEDFTSDLEPYYARFFAGGEVSYYHFKTTYLETGRLSAAEIANLAPGNEIRGNGFIIADREDEEANGNTGELDQLLATKPRYGNLSYLEGFQNTKSRNFIRDYVDILDAGNSKSMFVLNLRYSTPQAELEKIDFLIEEGVQIIGIECGNEAYAKTHPWYNPGNPTINAPLSVEEYLDTCDTYRDLILASHPGIPFAVSAAPKKNFEEGAEWEASDFNTEWNISLATKMNEHGYDNYTVHFYAPFNSCEDEIATGDRDSIFACGLEEIRDLRNTVEGPNGTVRLPVIFSWYKENFPGKNMWFTEWNINQDPLNGTDAKYANSILHAAFVTNVMNIINMQNAYNGNFIPFANLHTYVTDGGNAMINLHVSKGVGNSEPEDTGEFVRRTPYFAYMSMKEIFQDDYKPLETTFTINTPGLDPNDVTIYGYKKDNGDIALAFTNLTDKTLHIDELTIDGETVDLNSSSANLYSIDGDANYASRGKTEFAVNPGHEVTVRENDFYSSITNLYIPSFGISTITINTDIIEDNPGCTILENITGNCDEGEVTDEPESDTEAPTVELVGPADKFILNGATTAVAASAADNIGIQKVEFYYGSTGDIKNLIATDDTAPYKSTWNTAQLPVGTYRVGAKAYDTSGNSTFSNYVTVKKQ